ncbi:hypothetical protein [Devosia alba]|uniref:hypothetical protein n=1 Tax=Devosia alba TaxID=3152360 RepID=UPI003267AC4F
MPWISETELAARRRVEDTAAAVAAKIQQDETGDIIGTTFTGNGNGGNMSTELLRLKGQLQLDLAALHEAGGDQS